jgi:hypothetical protein
MEDIKGLERVKVYLLLSPPLLLLSAPLFSLLFSSLTPLLFSYSSLVSPLRLTLLV